MSDLSPEHKHECDMTLALLALQTMSKQVLKARLKLLDAFRCDEDVASATRLAIAAYLVAGIEKEIPSDLQLRAHHILFGGGEDPNNPLGKTGVLYSYADALATPTIISWVVDGLFTPCSVNLLFGEGGTKKTYAMIDLAIAVTRGSDSWLDFDIPEPLVCLFVDEESGPRRFADRLKRVGSAHEADSNLPLYYISLAGLNLTTLDGQDKLHKLISEIGAGLVILDALVDVMAGGDENAVSDVQPIFVGLRRIAEMTNSAILVIHHANRAGAYRGSSALKGAVDTMLMVASDSDVVTFSTEKARDIEPITFHALANFGEGTFNLSPTVGTKQADKVQPLILNWLAGPDGLNQSQLVALGKDHGTGRNSVLAALNTMEKSGLITISAGSGAARLYSKCVV